MKTVLDNCGQRVEAVFSEANANEIFLPLLRRLGGMQRERGGRVLALLAAPPGAGKSTLAAFLRKLSLETPGMRPLTVIGMDGFHWRQRYLDSHTVMRDGASIPLAAVKGAPESFDLESLSRALKRVAAGEECRWPVYDRARHDPVPDALAVNGDIVLLEGNYLLLDAPGWRELRNFADFSVFIEADPEMLRGRLIARHIAGGKDEAAAAGHVDGSDMRNVRLVLSRALPADLRLRLRDDDGFDVVTETQKMGLSHTNLNLNLYNPAASFPPYRR